MSGRPPAEGENEPLEAVTGEQLAESWLATYIDENREHALYFLEGQALIRDLALTHFHPERGFAFFRQIVLSVQPLIALLKGREQLGFYVDSESPFFRFKLESSHAGDTRAVLFPEDFSDFPPAMRGLVRVEKRSAAGRQPYQSIVEARDLGWSEIVNRVLRESYQVKAAVLVSSASDQSLLLHGLPTARSEDDTHYSADAVRARLDELRPGLDEIFARALQDADQVTEALSSLGFRRLSSRPVRFRCSCSRERVIHSLRLVGDVDSLFDPGQSSLEATCDYCRTAYVVTRPEIEAPPDIVH